MTLCVGLGFIGTTPLHFYRMRQKCKHHTKALEIIPGLRENQTKLRPQPYVFKLRGSVSLHSLDNREA